MTRIHTFCFFLFGLVKPGEMGCTYYLLGCPSRRYVHYLKWYWRECGIAGEGEEQAWEVLVIWLDLTCGHFLQWRRTQGTRLNAMPLWADTRRVEDRWRHLHIYIHTYMRLPLCACVCVFNFKFNCAYCLPHTHTQTRRDVFINIICKYTHTHTQNRLIQQLKLNEWVAMSTAATTAAHYRI